MVSSSEIVRKVQQAVSPEDWKVIESSIAEIKQGEGRRAQKTLEKDIYNLVTNYAFKNNKPELLLALSGFANNDIDRLFSQIILKYIITQDENWLKTVFPLSETLEKKSYQSRIFAMMAKTLIEAGVSESKCRIHHFRHDFARTNQFQEISFRCYDRYYSSFNRMGCYHAG